ncbi:MAG: GTP pyrophosphokinase family protein [Vallitaleaceae bacterium]|nr:GTP pyrophosphokinase family protein [Vallitaleaceae bacterium]
MLKDQIRDFLFKEMINNDGMQLFRENTMPYQVLMSYYRCAIMEVETKFKVLNEQFSLQYERNPIETIKSRLKNPEAILEKINRKNHPFSIESIEENIFDVAGVRVICSFPKDIFMLANLLLKQDDIVLIEKRDYIKNPKPSGYRSLHLIIEVPIFLVNGKKMMKVEVQLRTIAMDFWASLEHKVHYKKDLPKEEAKALAQELAACSFMSAELDAKMEHIKDRIQSKIYEV